MNLSYTQNLEDYHLALAFAGQAKGTYIDIGAGHPVADNVSFWFYERGWRGIVVEPQADLAALSGRLRPRDTTVRALIGRADGESDFFLVDRLHGFSSTVEQHARKAEAFGAGYRKLRLPVMTLKTLCETYHLREIDFPTHSPHPRTFKATDFERLVASPHFFARKFDESVDAAILDRLGERIGAPSHDHSAAAHS